SRNMASPWGGNLPAIQGSEWADVLPVDWSQVPPILSLTDFPLIAGGVGALAAPSGHRLEGLGRGLGYSLGMGLGRSLGDTAAYYGGVGPWWRLGANLAGLV